MNKKISSKTMKRIALAALGCLLIFSGTGKIFYPPADISFFGMNSGFIGLALHILPLWEVTLGLIFVINAERLYFIIKWLAIATIMVFIASNFYLIATGDGINGCGECLGWGIDLWPGGSLFIDLIMLSIVIVGAFDKKEVVYGIN